MRVLVACEFSGRVRDAFIRNGHDAISCDLYTRTNLGTLRQNEPASWLKNLPLLTPTDIVENSEKNLDRYHRFTLRNTNPHDRSRTFQGIADAMGDQWGSLE